MDLDNYDSQWKKSRTKDIGIFLIALYLVLSRKKFLDQFSSVCRYCFVRFLSFLFVIYAGNRLTKYFLFDDKQADSLEEAITIVNRNRYCILFVIYAF